MTKRPAYQTDINDTAWTIIESKLPKIKQTGRPRTYELREIVNALFYVLRGGIAWRLMPHDLPPWRLVYIYFWKWKKSGVYEEINAALIEKARAEEKREKEPSLGIIDSQSVKSAHGGEAIGIDGNKKVNGRKRHVVTDSQGRLLAVKVTAANVSDLEGGKAVLTKLSAEKQGDDREKSYRLSKILADGVYASIVPLVLSLFGWVLEITKRPEGQKGFVVQPKRWVIERFHAWQGRYRRLSKDYECSVSSSEAMCYLASIHRLARIIG